MNKNTKIRQMEITDEFLMADSKEGLNVIAQKLRKLHMEGEGGAILITKDDKEVIGFITELELLDLIAEGKNITKVRALDVMSTDFVEVMEDETLGNIMPLISKKYPNAIVVINSERKCVGYFSKNDYKDAMAVLGVYNQSHKPENSNDWRTKGIALSSLGKKIEALKCYEKSLLSSSNKERGWTDLAKRLERINKHKDAIMCLDKAITINSKNDDALIARGNIYSKENTQNLAIQSYNRALEINPNNIDALMFMGMEQASLGEIEEAMKCLARVEDITGETAEIWFRKGNVFNKAKMYKDAVNCYNNAIKIDDGHEDAWFNKGVTYNLLGKNKEALDCMENLLKINPNNESAKEAVESYEKYGSFRFF